MYRKKYLKYKMKYLKLKEQFGQGVLLQQIPTALGDDIFANKSCKETIKTCSAAKNIRICKDLDYERLQEIQCNIGEHTHLWADKPIPMMCTINNNDDDKLQQCKDYS